MQGDVTIQRSAQHAELCPYPRDCTLSCTGIYVCKVSSLSMRLGSQSMAICRYDVPHPDQDTSLQKHAKSLAEVHHLRNMKQSEWYHRIGLNPYRTAGACLVYPQRRSSALSWPAVQCRSFIRMRSADVKDLAATYSKYNRHTAASPLATTLS